MGEKVTMMEALVVTAVSMIVVFLVLILISYIIGLLKTLSTGKPKTVEKAQPVEQPVASTTPAAPVAVEAPDQGELIAVIAAAVAASLGKDIPEIRIASIRRVPQQSIPWREIGKQEQLLGRL